MAKLYVVGIGPGGLDHLTPAARQALAAAAVVVGYQTYLDFITPLLAGKEVVSSGMMKEVERCEAALRLAAEGKDVALVSSGDAGIYGMAGLVLELVEADAEQTEAAAAAPGGRGRHRPGRFCCPGGGLGTRRTAHARLCRDLPLRPDDAVEAIRQRLAAAADADFVVALYNPRSKGRVTQLEEARQILLTRALPQLRSASSATPAATARRRW